jgi:hypothetical protein
MPPRAAESRWIDTTQPKLVMSRRFIDDIYVAGEKALQPGQGLPSEADYGMKYKLTSESPHSLLYIGIRHFVDDRGEAHCTLHDRAVDYPIQVDRYPEGSTVANPAQLGGVIMGHLVAAQRTCSRLDLFQDAVAGILTHAYNRGYSRRLLHSVWTHFLTRNWDASSVSTRELRAWFHKAWTQIVAAAKEKPDATPNRRPPMPPDLPGPAPPRDPIPLQPFRVPEPPRPSQVPSGTRENPVDLQREAMVKGPDSPPPSAQEAELVVAPHVAQVMLHWAAAMQREEVESACSDGPIPLQPFAAPGLQCPQVSSGTRDDPVDLLLEAMEEDPDPPPPSAQDAELVVAPHVAQLQSQLAAGTQAGAAEVAMRSGGVNMPVLIARTVTRDAQRALHQALDVDHLDRSGLRGPHPAAGAHPGPVSRHGHCARPHPGPGSRARASRHRGAGLAGTAPLPGERAQPAGSTGRG